MASLAILLLLARLSSAMATSSNYIARSDEQQIIATVAPAVFDADGVQGVQPFLTSPSGSYGAYLRRAVVGSGGGDGGANACYVQIELAGGGNSVWESECTLVGGADACDLAFSPVGLELFAGGHSLWDTGIEDDPGTLSLDDGGDMTIVSKDGVTVWRASGEPWTGQQCGSPLPVSSPSMNVLPPPPPSSAAIAKVVTPPVTNLAGPGSTDFSFGDQLMPPADTFPGSTDEPLLLPPPPADESPDSPDLVLPPPPVDTYPVSPDQPLYSSPPLAPTSYVPQTPMPPVDDDIPLTPPATSAGATSPVPGAPLPPGIVTPPAAAAGLPGNIAFPPAAPIGGPRPHVPPVPHNLPFGAVAPNAGHGAAAAGLPFGQGQGQQQGVLLNGAGQPLEESSGGWSRIARGGGGAAVRSGLAGLVLSVLVFLFPL